MTKWFKFNSKSLPWIQYHTITPCYHDFHPFKFRNAYSDSHSQFISRNDYGFSFEFLTNGKRDELFLLGSSNGLVLCVYPWELTHLDRYHVCNPLTQKWVSLPIPRRYFGAGRYEYSGILCENPFSESCCYKVVSIPRFTSSKKFNVDVFYSDLGEWRNFDVSCDQDVSEGFGSDKNVICVNGVLFLLEGRDRMSVYNVNQNSGSNEHRCSLINLPGPTFTWQEFDEFDDEFNIFNGRTLGESEGRICYAGTRVTRRQITVTVWVLDEDNWKVLHKDILVRDTLAEICLRTCDVSRIKVSGFSPIDCNVVLLGCGVWGWWYDIKTGNFEELGHSSLLANRDTGLMYESFVLQTMPTILPPPSWIDDEHLRFYPSEDLPSDMEDVCSIAQLFSSEEDLQEVVDDDDMTIAEQD